MLIGNLARSKNENGQIKVPGRIVALLQADFYTNYLIPPGCGGKEQLDFMWAESYPNWADGLLAILMFDEPQRTATVEEWISSGMNKGISRQECEESYDKLCPIAKTVVFPLDDLELVNVD